MYLLAADYDDFDVLVARAKDLEQNLIFSARVGKRPVEGSLVGGTGKRLRDRGTPGYVQRGTNAPDRGVRRFEGHPGVCWLSGSRGHHPRDCSYQMGNVTC